MNNGIPRREKNLSVESYLADTPELDGYKLVTALQGVDNESLRQEPPQSSRRKRDVGINTPCVNTPRFYGYGLFPAPSSPPSISPIMKHCSENEQQDDSLGEGENQKAQNTAQVHNSLSAAIDIYRTVTNSAPAYIGDDFLGAPQAYSYLDTKGGHAQQVSPTPGDGAVDGTVDGMVDGTVDGMDDGRPPGGIFVLDM